MTTADIELVVGQSAIFQITVRDDTGAYVDISSPTNKLEFTIKKSIHDQLALVTKRGGNGIILLSGGLTGQLELRLMPADTVDLAPGSYEYDFWVTLASGRFPALRGKLQLLSAVNKVI